VNGRPLTLLIAASIVALEGLVALGLGGYVAVQTLTGAPDDISTALAVAGFGLLVGAGLLWVAWGGLFRTERWGRSPGVLTQIFMLPVGGTLITSGQPQLGILMIVVSLAGLVTLLAPPTTQALYGDGQASDADPSRR
jgi:ABC-type transport system involved in cytochrome c biogenesis permease subunit